MLMVFSGFGFGSSARASAQWLRSAATRTSLDERAARQFIRASAHSEAGLSKNPGLAFEGPTACCDAQTSTFGSCRNPLLARCYRLVPGLLSATTLCGMA